MINFFFYLSFSYSVDETVKQAGTKKQQKADFKPTGRQSMYGQASAPSRPTTVRQKNWPVHRSLASTSATSTFLR